MDTAAGWRMAGFTVGAGVAFALSRTYLFDLAPVALALSVVIGALIGGAVTPRPARTRGVASLRPRRMRAYVPAPAVVAIGALALGVLTFAWYPTPDLPDHSATYFGTAPPTTLTSTLATLGGAVLLAALAGWAIVRSPQAGPDGDADDAWRRATVHAIVHTCAALFALVFAAIAFWYADQQLDWRGGGSPPWGFALSGLGGLGLVVFAWTAGASSTVASTTGARTGDEVATGSADA